MFCTKCGAKLVTGVNFCTFCGNPVTIPSAPSQAPSPASSPRAQSMIAAQPAYSPTPQTPAAAAEQTCQWCGAVIDASSQPVSNCPKCGAALSARTTASISGWIELPPRKDMAKLQFGNSSCQIEGLYVPAAEMKLAPEDSVYFSHHVLLWMDPQVRISTMSMRGGWKRMFAGLPLIMAQAQGPGHIAFSKDEPGELIALPLHAGQAIDVREHMFLVATSNVQYDWFAPQLWYQIRDDKETETFYPVGYFMDRFYAATPGLLLLHAGGSVLVRNLAPGEAILVKPTALIFKDPTVQMQLHLEHPNAGMFSWGAWNARALRSIWLTLIGPGRVAIQSVFERLERESGNLVNSSYATSQYW